VRTVSSCLWLELATQRTRYAEEGCIRDAQLLETLLAEPVLAGGLMLVLDEQLSVAHGARVSVHFANE